MTHMLLPLANGRLVMALEVRRGRTKAACRRPAPPCVTAPHRSRRLCPRSQGGYNIASISMSAAACVSVLLGAPPLPLESTVPSDVAIRTVQRVLHKQAKYWSSLRPQFLDPRTYYNDEDTATRPATGGRPEGTP